MYCTECRTRVDASGGACGECGGSPVDGGVAVPDGGEAAAEPPATVPDDAVAVDVPCPHCNGRNPIESVAKGYRITGMVLVMQRKTLRFVGCQPCIRRKLLWASVKNLLLGWWGIKSAIMNPFATGWNVVRGFVSRGPNENLAQALSETGIPFEFISDKSEYDPGAHHDEELYLNGMLQLAAAITMADDDISDDEIDAITDVTDEMFPAYETAEVAERVREFASEGVDVDEVTGALSMMLTDEGCQLVLAFAMQVAAADEEIEEAEMELLGEIAGALGLSEQQVKELLEEPAAG